jgi:hypothetical protein
MTQWVYFDEAGAGALQPMGAAATLGSGNPLMAALRGSGNSVVIMPTGTAQELALISVVKGELPKRTVAPVVESARPISRAATGFLGLTDEPEFVDEPEKKPWWKRWGS